MGFLNNLDDYLSLTGITEAALEQKCGLAKGCVYKWRYVYKSPSMKNLMRLERGTLIPATAWITEGGVRDALAAH